MGKNDKSTLGRALVKHHNQMVQQSKEKGQFNRQKNRIMESVTDVNDIDAVIEQAEEADRVYSIDNPVPNLLINLDMTSGSSDTTPTEKRDRQRREEALHASSLRVPRRPRWNAKMSVEELEANERQSFLVWRRSLASLEENEKLVLTPFEKNLDIWRQLWRVLERSDLLVMVVDARDPLFYRCPDLEAYAREIDEYKRTMLLVNKADLLPITVRRKWAEYFRLHGILFVFWSAKAASAVLGSKKLSSPWKEHDMEQNSDISDDDIKVYGRDELLARLQTEAEAIASTRRASGNKSIGPLRDQAPDASSVMHPASKHVVVGFVGYPNVGKSSTINALMGEKRTGVTSTPGKTKHFQTLIISDKLMLCDCPGLVFPSFSSSRYEMVASGVLPIDRMTEQREAVQVVAERVPRHVLENIYNITLSKPKPYENQSRPPLASELLRAYCSSRRHVTSSGLPDETRAARQILKDYIDGKLPHFEFPPGMPEEDGEVNVRDETGDAGSYQSNSSDVEDQISCNAATIAIDCADGSDLKDVLTELNTFDTSNGLASAAGGVKKKASAASHKQHKKPQRKKDRSWRVRNDGGDGMPVVGVFQKPVKVGGIKAS